MSKILKLDEFTKINETRVMPEENPKGFEIVKNAVRDADGNSYDGIKINGKLWMASNLMTTKFNDGTEIGRFADSEVGTKPYFEYPKISKSELKNYGLHYNFMAVDTKMLAPIGWHVPSKEEWEDLFDFIAKFPEYNNNIDRKRYNDVEIAKAMCSKVGWQKGIGVNKNAIGDDPQLNNATGFNIYPSGSFGIEGKTGYSEVDGVHAYLWSSTPLGKTKFESHAFAVHTLFNWPYFNIDGYYKELGICVRCVKD
jgi:uncharacterized protein (TIGR02145 family)